MARIRTIKPEFFTSEQILALTPWARLLFIALLCEADREGRFPWKPRTFKVRYFPVDDVDIDACCRQLLDADLVRRYGDGLAYIPTFTKHQLVNPREAKSTLAAPEGPRVTDASLTGHLLVKAETPESEELTRQLPVTDAHVGRKEGKEGKEGTEPPLPINGHKAKAIAQANGEIPEADPTVEARAGAWLETYPAKHYEVLSVPFTVVHRRDWPKAVILAEAVSDDRELDAVTDLALRAHGGDWDTADRTPGFIVSKLSTLRRRVKLGGAA